MCAENHHPFGLPGPLVCLGTGPGHTHRFEASELPDSHDLTEDAAERRHEL